MNPAELFRRDDDPVRLAPGQTLFREGDTGDSMYVLLEGSADVFVGEILVESATPGALLGEMALVDSQSAHRHGRCNDAGAPGQDR
jgi:CRP-like cAMP-binding protein